jgi:predicted DNA-binding protein
MPTDKEKNERHLGVLVSPSVYKALRYLALDNDRTVGAEVREALEKHLASAHTAENA